jgi:hypothetical protein
MLALGYAPDQGAERLERRWRARSSVRRHP